MLSLSEELAVSCGHVTEGVVTWCRGVTVTRVPPRHDGGLRFVCPVTTPRLLVDIVVCVGGRDMFLCSAIVLTENP